MRATILLFTLFIISSPVRADWTLDNAGSQLSFVSIKATDVAEVNTFDEMSGSVGADGHARVVIQLASVNTLIPIRDERIREVLFQTDLFPTAIVDARLDIAAITAMAPSTSQVLTTELLLTVGESQLPITADLLVSRLAADRLLVATLKPIIVNAGSLSLSEGIEALREIAGLPNISKSVPVSFVVQFSAG